MRLESLIPPLHSHLQAKVEALDGTLAEIAAAHSPCTRPATPGEDVRAGRWWWEAAESRECGLHLAPDQAFV
ncbi:MAG TPA: hypothetical protein VJM14_04150 [Burkholderiales bacterium]|nr:hypothetical protein [Burkholderiales bacterium]